MADQKIKINTPKGGFEIYILLLTHKDDIIGNLKFTDKESMLRFKDAYYALPDDEWGTIELGFDTRID
jgi:hypothetical protein